MHIKLMAEIALRLLLPSFVDMSCRSVQYSDRVHSIEFVSFMYFSGFFSAGQRNYHFLQLYCQFVLCKAWCTL